MNDTDKRDLCRYCRKPVATDDDYAIIPEGDGAWLCWSPWQGCHQDAEEAIDLRDAEIERLKRENETFSNAQKACKDCDALRIDHIAELERELADAFSETSGRWRRRHAMSDAIRKGDFLLVAIPYDDCGGEEPEMSAEIEFADLVESLPPWLARRIELRGIERKESRHDP